MEVLEKELEAFVDNLEEGPKRISLQFPDESLHLSLDVYEYLREKLPTNIDLFVLADSTFGSSVDDVSAQHIDCDLLIYFGSDLSSSGSMPVLVIPPRSAVDANHAAGSLCSKSLKAIESRVLVLYEPGCYHVVEDIIQGVAERRMNNGLHSMRMILARMPACTQLDVILHGKSSEALCNASKTLLVGGLLVDSHELESLEDMCVWYIGDKEEQLNSIQLYLSSIPILIYSAIHRSISSLIGEQTRVFSQRYGGVSRVEDADIVGIIVGSMGLTAELTMKILLEIQQQITAANKKYYTFIMGRLNEAKLCNFPEIDIFCLVSNEDTALIKPKTFHVPVITPHELFLGLGCLEWKSYYTTNALSLPSGFRKSEPSGGDDEVFTGANKTCASSDIECSKCSNSAVDDIQELNAAVDTWAVSNRNNEDRISTFTSPAAAFLHARQYQGLVAEVSGVQSTTLHQGSYGVASTYQNEENKD